MNIGDQLRPLSLWNETEKHRKLADQVEVVDFRNDNCQTGIMVLVNDKYGRPVWLDRGWFEE
jgi:hypothetical protein